MKPSKPHFLLLVALLGLTVLSGRVDGQTNAPAAAVPTAPPPLEASTTPATVEEWIHTHDGFVADAKARADQIQLVFLGDSITKRWTQGAGQATWVKRYAPLGAINLAISSDATQNVLWRIENGELDPLHPKAVILLAGTNNVPSEQPDAIAYGVWTIVNEIRTKHPETRVLVQGIFPREDNLPVQGGKLWPKIPLVNQLLAKLDDGKMVKYIYFGDKFLNSDGSLKREWFTDGTHPEKPEAFELWADAIQPIIDDWLKTPPIPNVPPPPSPVPVPADKLSSTPLARHDWLFMFNRQPVRAAKGNCDLLFLGGTELVKWSIHNPQLFQQEYGADKALNFALFGSRTENVLWELDHGGINGLHPKVIAVQFQDNLADNTPAENVAAGMAAIVQRLRQLQPQAKILLLGALPMGTSPTDPLRLKIAQYNDLLSRQADGKTVYFVDVGKPYLKPDGTLETTPMQFPFVPSSFDLWAAAQRDIIAALLKAP